MMNTRDIVECIISIMYQAAVEYRSATSIYGMRATDDKCKRILQEQCRLERQYRDRIALLCIAVAKVESGEY